MSPGSLLTFFTFVNIFGTVDSFVATGTGTDVRSVNRTGVADGACVARVTGARVFQMTEKSRFARRTMAIEGSNAVIASGAIETSCIIAIVYILATIRAGPAIDANTTETTDGVGASGSVLADTRLHSTFVDIFGTIRS